MIQGLYNGYTADLVGEVIRAIKGILGVWTLAQKAIEGIHAFSVTSNQQESYLWA